MNTHTPDSHYDWTKKWGAGHHDKKFYPDHFELAASYYQDHIDHFRNLAGIVPDSIELYRQIMQSREPGRTQMLRIFTRYVSPKTSVEMLKRVANVASTIEQFGEGFRDISLIRDWIGHTEYDAMLAVIMWEYKDRGKVGYDLTEDFFDWFENRFPSPEWQAIGKRRGGQDIELRTKLPGYEHDCPTDILVYHKGNLVMVGFARYDFDRGGSQGSDRIGGNRSKFLDILDFESGEGIPLKVFFLNDGPGLGIGELWGRYGRFEQVNSSRILVSTLKMLPTRLTRSWMLGK